MSQGDYIQLKRLRHRLQNQKQLSPILSSQDYTDFASFSAETSVVNTLPVYSSLLLPSTANVLDVTMSNSSGCLPSFFLCDPTDYHIHSNSVDNPANLNPIVDPLNQAYTYNSASLSCKQGCPYRTHIRPYLMKSNGRPLLWSGDNRIKVQWMQGWK